MAERALVLRTVGEMQALSDEWRCQGHRVGCVTTMGYLHEGHLSLVRRAGRDADRLVVTVFVNPTQFGPLEDFDRYPRDFEADRSRLEAIGVDAIFAPDVAEIYPEGFSTRVEVDGLTDRLCGASRPGHFGGVALVVTKLFNVVKPTFAVFGQKDAQQALVIRRLTKDLDFDVEILVSPSIRECDGLAKSSRNVYLTEVERRRSARLFHALQAGMSVFRRGEKRVDRVLEQVRADLSGSGEVEYAEAVDLETLRPVERIEEPTLLAVAVRFGGARLIDNLILRPPEAA
ncbi:MAG: pantoate--beta-alanine ligase [Gemmatimonadetes bacterium]|nr:pantoate--beta-alanine ligase [Gemmatimonadota bacterium]|tara:strand:+ start:2768 stop:3631 length:864 start_codon:yes stop_codon:yes gene_type:complete